MTLVEKILNFSVPVPEAGCWLWDRHHHRQGYGWVRHEGRLLLAHRASYEAFNGSIPPGLKVLHRCDTPECVNPSHLFLGTQRDNVADMHAKGRDRKSRGEAHGRARLKEDDIRKIRARRASGEILISIGADYGINASYVKKICDGDLWKHVT